MNAPIFILLVVLIKEVKLSVNRFTPTAFGIKTSAIGNSYEFSFFIHFNTPRAEAPHFPKNKRKEISSGEVRDLSSWGTILITNSNRAKF